MGKATEWRRGVRRGRTDDGPGDDDTAGVDHAAGRRRASPRRRSTTTTRRRRGRSSSTARPPATTTPSTWPRPRPPPGWSARRSRRRPTISTPAWPASPRASSAQPTVQTWNSTANSNDANYDVAARGSYVYSAGATRNASDNLDLMVIRWSSTTGAFKWVKRYAGAAGEDDLATDVVIDSAGNAIVCGIGGERARVAPTGSCASTRPPATSSGRIPTTGQGSRPTAPPRWSSMRKDNIYVTGYSRQDLVTGAFTVKLSPAGAKLWTRKYRGPDDNWGVATAIARRPAGGVYIGGYTNTDADGQDAFLIHYTAAGDRKVYTLYTANTVARHRADHQRHRRRLERSDHRRRSARTTPTRSWVLWNTAGDIDDADYRRHRRARLVASGRHRRLRRRLHDRARTTTTPINPNIRTMRMSVLPGGGRWLYDDDGNGLQSRGHRARRQRPLVRRRRPAVHGPGLRPVTEDLDVLRRAAARRTVTVS